MYYNVALGDEKNFYFLLKTIIQCGDGNGMGFNFSSPLDMGRVMGKYMRIGYENWKCKTRPTPPHCYAY